MRIEMDAKIILTIPEPSEKESADDVMLAVEQYLNSLTLFKTTEHTLVGIRVHITGRKC